MRQDAPLHEGMKWSEGDHQTRDGLEQQRSHAEQREPRLPAQARSLDRVQPVLEGFIFGIEVCS